MISLDFLDEIDQKLEDFHASPARLRSKDFVMPSDQNRMLIAEEGEWAHVAILLQEDLLRQFENLNSKVLPDDLLSDFMVLVEELSHFKIYCESARRNQEINRLAMEVQAEVDKFAFALDRLEEANFLNLRHQVFEQHFQELRLGSWVSEDEKPTYERAHAISKRFCRQLLHETSRFEEMKKAFRSFFSSSFANKTRMRF